MAFSTEPPGWFSADPFGVAEALTRDTHTFFETQRDYINDYVLATTFEQIWGPDGALTKLGEFKVPIPGDLLELPPLDPEIDTDLILNMDISDIDVSTFGSISPYAISDPPAAGGFPDVVVPEIPDFIPSIEGIVVPPPPGPGVFAEPGEPPINPGFSYPDAPNVVLPDAPYLWGLDIPPAPDIDLPTLTLADFPELTEMEIDTMIDWTEPDYTGEVWDNVKAQIVTFLAGGTGIRPDVEEAIVNRGRDREDRIVRQQIQEAVEEWANRGYTSPPGMLAKRIDTIREQGTLNKLGLQREVVIKAMEEELTNLRFACQQGLVAEQLFVQIHLAAVQRLFDVQRLHIQWQIDLYNLAVQVYSARLQENVIRAQVYEVQVRAALAEIEVFKALIEAERVKAEVNKSLIDAYRAEIDARQAIVNIYTAQVQAVKVQAEVFATEVGAYRAEVEALMASKIRADS